MPQQLPRLHSNSWLWIAAIWSAFALFDASQSIFMLLSEKRVSAWSPMFVTELASWLPWMLATPLIIRAARRDLPRGAASLPWDIWYPEESQVLQLVSQDSSKRGQPLFDTLVLQARPRWSRERVEKSEEEWRGELLNEAARLLGPWAKEPSWTQLHRWSYARTYPGTELAQPILGFWGREDGFCPVSGVQKFLNQCADARFVIFNKVGHWVMVERSAEFNRYAIDFLGL